MRDYEKKATRLVLTGRVVVHSWTFDVHEPHELCKGNITAQDRRAVHHRHHLLHDLGCEGEVAHNQRDE